MRYISSLINYSGIAYLFLQFAMLYGLRLNFYTYLLVMIFISYSFIMVLNADQSGKKMRIPLIVAIASVPIGALFILMQWPFNVEVFVTVVSMVGALYAIRFFLKKNIDVIDGLKLSVVLSGVIFIVLRLMHLPFSTEFGYISMGCGLVTYVVFMFSKEPVVIVGRELPRTTLNKDEIVISETVGCYKCETIFDGANQIQYDGATAICPNCGGATLIGSSAYNVTKGSLSTLKKEVAQRKM